MEKIRTIIIDHEPLPLKHLQDWLQEDDEIDLVGKCKNGKEAIVNITDKQPDLAFLHMQMPKVTGFEVLENIDKTARPVIVFITVYDQYVLQAFDVYSINYLLKPFDKKRFIETLERAKEYLRRTETALETGMRQLLDHHRSTQGYPSRIMVKTNNKIFFLNVNTIEWIEASGNYVNIHADGKSYLIRGTMNSMERKLNPAHFFRIHRSSIVNVDRIKELESWFHGDYKVILKNGKELVLSSNYKRLLQQFS